MKWLVQFNNISLPCHSEADESRLRNLAKNKTPMNDRQYYVYIISSISKVLYVGVTSNLKRRIWEHKQGVVEGFTKKYHVKKLVYYESTEDVTAAIQREKQIKKWRREKKIVLVEEMNPLWKDLYNEL